MTLPWPYDNIKRSVAVSLILFSVYVGSVSSFDSLSLVKQSSSSTLCFTRQPEVPLPEADLVRELTDNNLLDRQHEKTGNTFDSIPLLDAWERDGDQRGPAASARLLETLATLPAEELSRRHLAIAMDAWNRTGRDAQAQKNFQLLVDQTKGKQKLQPKRGAWTSLLVAKAKADHVEQARAVLGMMQQTLRSQPTTSNFNTVLSVYAKSGLAFQAEVLLKEMVDRCKQMEEDGVLLDGCPCQPDLGSYNALLEAHAKSGDRSAGDRAEAILQALEEEYALGDLSDRPDGRSFASVILAVLKGSNQKAALSRAEKLYKSMLDRKLDLELHHVQSVLLDIYSLAGTLESARKAEQLLEDMEAEGKANHIVYNKVLKAWKMTDAPEAIPSSEAIIKRMETRRLASRISYTTLIGALAAKGDRKSAMRANEILERMIAMYKKKGNEEAKPNTQTLNNVILAWSRSGNMDPAEQVLQQMEEHYNQGAFDLAPSVVSYTSIMDGWAKSEDKNSLQRVETAFYRMNEAFRSGNKEAEPNQFSYVTLINAYAKSRHAKSAQKAEDILFNMYEEYVNGKQDFKPNSKIVGLVIDSWQRSGSPDAGEKAEKILNWLISVYKENLDASLRPNEYTFSSTISAWGKSRRLGSFRRARSILVQMIDMEKAGVITATPNTICYTAVINACAYCINDDIDKRDALKIAIATYKDLEKSSHGTPNNVTFSTLLTALRNLLPKGQQRDWAIRNVFQSAAKSGYVDDRVIQRVQSALPFDEQVDLFQVKDRSAAESIHPGLLPADWSRNVPVKGGAKKK